MFCDGKIYDKVQEAFKEAGLHSTVIYTINEHRDGVPKLSDLLAPTQREEEFKYVNLLCFNANRIQSKINRFLEALN